MPDSWRSLYPFASHHRDAAVAGGQASLRQHYVDEGAGAPVLMVHGNPTWSFYWRELILGLRDRHRCVAVDHIGCGLSDKPQDYPYTLRTHADNLLGVVRGLDLREVTLVAHDWGGAIGLLAAVDEPDRFARIVLLNTGAFPPPYVPARIAACRIPWIGPWCVRALNLFAKAALTMAVEQPLPQAVQDGLLAPYDSWDHRIAIDQFVADIPMSHSHPTHLVLADLERRLPTLRAKKKLLVWGMRDWCFTPVCLRRFQSMWPEAKTIELDDCGHYVMEDGRAQVVAAVRDFLAESPV